MNSKMDWALFFDETNIRIYLIGLLALLTASLIAADYFPIMVPVSLFMMVVLVEYLKAVGMLMLVAVKRWTLEQFFWIDNATALALVIIGWFVVTPSATALPFWLVVVLYTMGWIGVFGLVNAVFKTKRTYRSFDIKYGAAEWMQVWWDED